MATLYVENVPDEVYEALRGRAREHNKSIAAEVLLLLEQNVPTADELKRRRALALRIDKIRARRPATPGVFPSAEEMLREDRKR
jgi:plasmid stability protein